MYDPTDYRYENPYTIENLEFFILEIENARHYTPYHWHDSFEIMLNISGSMTVIFQDKSITLQKDDCILINPYAIHAVKATADNAFILLQLPLSFVKRNIPDVENLYFNLHCHSTDPKIITKQSMFKKIIYDMNVAVKIKPDGYELRCKSLIYELLFQMYHSFSTKVKKTDTVSNRYQNRLTKIITYVSNNYDHEISLRDAAQLCHLQPEYFCRFFKKNMGITFFNYVSEIRLYHIYLDIINTNLPIHEIANTHGFTNYDTFLKKFKVYFSCNPADLRKKRGPRCI